MLEQERIINELQGYIRYEENEVIATDSLLGEANDGTEFMGGDVNDRLNTLHERMMLADMGKAKPVLPGERLFEGQFGFYTSYIRVSHMDE